MDFLYVTRTEKTSLRVKKYIYSINDGKVRFYRLLSGGKVAHFFTASSFFYALSAVGKVSNDSYTWKHSSIFLFFGKYTQIKIIHFHFITCEDTIRSLLLLLGFRTWEQKKTAFQLQMSNIGTGRKKKFSIFSTYLNWISFTTLRMTRENNHHWRGHDSFTSSSRI